MSQSKILGAVGLAIGFGLLSGSFSQSQAAILGVDGEGGLLGGDISGLNLKNSDYQNASIDAHHPPQIAFAS